MSGSSGVSVSSGGGDSSSVDPDPGSDHGLTPSSFDAWIRTSYVVAASRPVMVVLVVEPPRRCSVQSPPSAGRYATSYEVIGGLPLISGAVHVTSSSDSGELDDWLTDGASGRGGASSTSVTWMVTVTTAAG